MWDWLCSNQNHGRRKDDILKLIKYSRSARRSTYFRILLAIDQTAQTALLINFLDDFKTHPWSFIFHLLTPSFLIFSFCIWTSQLWPEDIWCVTVLIVLCHLSGRDLILPSTGQKRAIIFCLWSSIVIICLSSSAQVCAPLLTCANYNRYWE